MGETGHFNVVPWLGSWVWGIWELSESKVILKFRSLFKGLPYLGGSVS